MPAVTHLSVRLDKENRLLVPQDRNDDIAAGYSQLLCYQPMFGYGLERLHYGALRPGPALQDLGDGTLNLKNPACYQFPGANGCAPGDHFRLEQRVQAARFLRYEPFEFRKPAWQQAADAATIAAFALLRCWPPPSRAPGGASALAPAECRAEFDHRREAGFSPGDCRRSSSMSAPL